MIAPLFPLPPTGLEIDIYRGIRVHCISAQGAADMLRIPKVQVRDTLTRVSDFLAHVTPQAQEADREKRLAVAEQLASERVDFLYQTAVEAFRQSQGTQVTTRESAIGGSPPKRTTTRKTSAGDPRYLKTALQIALQGAKLTVSSLGVTVLADEEREAMQAANEAQAAQAAAEVTPAQEQPVKHPPVRAYSAFSADEAKSGLQAAQEVPSSTFPEDTYGDAWEASNETESEQFETVQ